MSVNQEDILKSAREEVERLLGELGRLGSVSEQQENAREGLSRAAEALRGAGTRFQTVLDLLGQAGEALQSLDASKMSGKLADLGARLSALETDIKEARSDISAINAAVAETGDRNEKALRTGLEQLGVVVTGKLDEAAEASSKALAIAEHDRQVQGENTRKLLDSLREKEEILEVQQAKMRTMIVVAIVIGVLAVLSPIVMRIAG